MPTFYDPGSDAGEASEALRGLAHASRRFEHPQDIYGVVGDLLGGVRSLRQVLEQLATAHASNRQLAFDDNGDHSAGSKDALEAADDLHLAATFIDQAEERLNSAMSAAGRIAWRSEPPANPVPVQRWINVCFLQGDDADELLQMLDDEGTDAALAYLKNWDYGDETTQAALENGYVYDLPPSGALEQKIRSDNYEMTFSHSFGHVGLYRLHEVSPTDALTDERPIRSEEVANDLQPHSSSSMWFEHPGVAAVKRARGLGL